jgi:NAD(P)-dependent dehydrogenase (short-subunit alcohol dehydrogenase family)
MRRTGGGVVINIASSGGIGYAAYGSPEYGATKAGLIRLTACLAGLPATHGVRAACVVPDWIGLGRAHEQLAAMPAEEHSATPPLIPPRMSSTLFLTSSVTTPDPAASSSCGAASDLISCPQRRDAFASPARPTAYGTK